MRIYIAALGLLFLLAACTPAQDTITFGVVVPLTGQNAFYGQFYKAGVELAVEDINANGGINGKQLVAIIEDAENDKALAASVANKLLHVDQVDALFVGTATLAGAVAPIGEAAEVPTYYWAFINAFAINKSYVFQDYPNMQEVCATLTEHAIKEGHENIAVFGTNAEFTLLCSYGVENTPDANMVAYETYTIGERDFRSQFLRIEQSGATAIMLIAFSNDCINAFKQVEELNLDVQLYLPATSFACGSTEVVDKLNGVPKGSMGADMVVASEHLESFTQRLAQRGAAQQVRGSAATYDGVQLMAQAFHRCKHTDCVIDYIEQADYSGITGTIQFAGKHTVQRDVSLEVYEDGWQLLKHSS